jgi:hypothetical protein
MVCGIACLIVISLAAQADNGAYGANRRVVATGGFGGVRGTFSEPAFTITQAQYEDSTHPDLYLGISSEQGHVETDSGITFSQVTQQDSQTGTIYPAKTWWGFSRISIGDVKGDMIAVRAAPVGGMVQDQWRVNKGSLGSVDIAVYLEPSGTYQLSITHGGTTYFKTDVISWPQENGQIRDDVVSGMIVKRVIAATQKENPAGGPFYDGFSMTGAGFSAGKVAPLSKTSTGSLIVGNYDNWSKAASKDDVYLPYGRNADPTTNQPTGIWVIDMDAPHQRDSNGVAANRQSLYDSEVVNINLLRRPTKLGGLKIKTGDVLNQY